MQSDPKTEATALLYEMEDDICKRTLTRVDEQAAALGLTRQELWPQLDRYTAARLERYMARAAKPPRNAFLSFRNRQTRRD